MNNKTEQILVIVTAIFMLVINGAANAIPLNGLDSGQISDRFEVYFVPAGYVFAIWGVIYIGIISFTIFQALPKNENHPLLTPIRKVVCLNFIINAFWLLAWHYEIFVATIPIMLGILGTLIYIYLKTGNGVRQLPLVEKLIVHLPFSIYMGWISVATIANVTSMSWLAGWRGEPLTEEIWTAIMFIIATTLGYLVSRSRRDVAYLLVFVWAFVGIAYKHTDTPLVVGSASIAAVAITVILFMHAFNKPKQSSRLAV